MAEEEKVPEPSDPPLSFDPSRMVGIIKRKALIKDLAAAYHAECLQYCQELLELQTKWEEAATFIARLRGEWRLEKLNSIKEKGNASSLPLARDMKMLDEAKTPALAKWAEAFAADPAVKGVLPETDKLMEFAKVYVQNLVAASASSASATPK